jgi:hypothetical protein|uniref:Uncharacterized protein n=1 Tax=Siphoviridae sp. ctwQT14 TaxID=2827971 RepID=A0A8S5TJY6_9CAUD|nr:MAG TPA: hypothetical protein [Siphoviridae sp. ctwQT14]
MKSKKINLEKENLNKFTKELTELSKKYGVVLSIQKVRIGELIDVFYKADFANSLINTTKPEWRFNDIDWSYEVKEKAKRKSGGFYYNIKRYADNNNITQQQCWTMAMKAIVTLSGVDEKVARRFLDCGHGTQLAQRFNALNNDFEKMIKAYYFKDIRPFITEEKFQEQDNEFYKKYCLC